MLNSGAFWDGHPKNILKKYKKEVLLSNSFESESLIKLYYVI